MPSVLPPSFGEVLAPPAGSPLPSLLQRDDKTSLRFLEFFATQIRNPNTRAAYARAVGQFLEWCEGRGACRIEEITPMAVAAYLEQHPGAIPTVKQHLAAIRMCFDWLVTGQILDTNPAHSVRGPRYSVTRGKTPVLSADQARRLLESVDVRTLAGLRDRALLATMVYSFARVSAVVSLRVEDYYLERGRPFLRLLEKGGKRHDVPVHHKLQEFLDAYVTAAGLGAQRGTPLFRGIAKDLQSFTEQGLSRVAVLGMVKRRAKEADLPPEVCCHTFRATGITVYLEGGGTLEKAQQIAAHASPRTTKLYDRTNDQVTLDEIEKIHIY
jgi:integrase/recombinase XerD